MLIRILTMPLIRTFRMFNNGIGLFEHEKNLLSNFSEFFCFGLFDLD